MSRSHGSRLLYWAAGVWRRLTDLSVMMLGFTVTTSVFTPTSMVYFSEMGGRLHLQKTQGSLAVLTHSFQRELERGQCEGVGKARWCSHGQSSAWAEQCPGSQQAGILVACA